MRFEVQEGKGILRVARPGVLIDPPARALGMEERLSAAQLRSTRFILVWDGGRARQGHLLNRIDELQLERVETDRWHELEIVVDGGFRYVVLAASMPPREAQPPRPKSRRPSLSELRQALDSITVHDESAEDVDSALASLTGPPPPPPRSLEEVMEAPGTGGMGAPPPPVIGARTSTARVNYPSTHEAQRPARRGESTPAVVTGPQPRGKRVLEDAPTMTLEGARSPLPRPPAEDEGPLAFGSAGEPEGMLLAAEAGDDPLSDLPEMPPMPVVPGRPDGTTARAITPVVRAAPQGTPVAFHEGFTDESEEAAFSIDLPTHRKSTEHVVVRRGEEEEDGVFAREELPPMEDLLVAAPAEDEEIEPALPDGEDEGVLMAEAAADDELLAAEGDVDEMPIPADGGAIAAGEEETTAHEVLPTPRPPLPPPAAPAPAPVSAKGEPPGEGRALVRHLRRKEEAQRVRIAELEAELAELRAKLAGSPARG